MFYYLNNFLLYSILGFFLESLTFAIIGMHNQSGFMYLWWTPFYGTGIIIILGIYHWSKKWSLKKRQKYPLLFIIYFLVLTLLEYIGGQILYFLHGYDLWSYANIPLHLGKYVSLGTSFIWASMAMIYLLFIKKYSDKLCKKIPRWLTILGTLIFICDFLLTMQKLISIKNMLFSILK